MCVLLEWMSWYVMSVVVVVVVVGGGFAVPRHPTRRSKTQYTVAEMMHGRKVELLNAG